MCLIYISSLVKYLFISLLIKKKGGYVVFLQVNFESCSYAVDPSPSSGSDLQIFSPTLRLSFYSLSKSRRFKLL